MLNAVQHTPPKIIFYFAHINTNKTGRFKTTQTTDYRRGNERQLSKFGCGIDVKLDVCVSVDDDEVG